MKRRGRIAFSLFPFVSILLCMVGVLTFLSIAIAVMSPEVEKKSENPYALIYEKRGENAKTWFIEFKGSNISIMEIKERINQKRHLSCEGRDTAEKAKNRGCLQVYSFMNEIAAQNSRRGGDLARYDQFHFIVRPSGVKNYLFVDWFINTNQGKNFTGNVRRALVLLEEDQEFDYDN